MVRNNPLKFPKGEYNGQEFSPTEATDGTPMSTTWTWRFFDNSTTDGVWERLTHPPEQVEFIARPPLVVDIDPDESKVTYSFDLNDTKEISYKTTYNIDLYPEIPPSILLNGQLTPKLYVMRGNRYVFDYKKIYDQRGAIIRLSLLAGPKGNYASIINGLLYENDGVYRDEVNHTLTWIVEGDAPTGLHYWADDGDQRFAEKTLTPITIRDSL